MHKCKFSNDCLHLAQYKGLGKKDFVASCTPGLLFDLNMGGYLEFLIKAQDETTDDAMLGTETQELNEFDFAILDDYSISNLYTDIHFSESEFISLKKFWTGTHTGEFASLMLKAFEKKKSHKIVKTMRNAFESTAEHHKEIAERLTQHARIGIINRASTTLASDETKEVLSE